jgi:methylated-DNA-[protein]-cysteine S-methyltransferase
MNEIIVRYYKTPYGELVLGSFGDALCLCDWRYRNKRSMIDRRLEKNLDAHFVMGDGAVIARTIQQLNEYFNFERKTFDIPLLLVGTDFQKIVWNKLIKVTYGKTASYMQLAKSVGNIKAVRPVASANGANAISIIVPCHRIIGSDGALVGYAGGLRAKQKLLELENNLFLQ